MYISPNFIIDIQMISQASRTVLNITIISLFLSLSFSLSLMHQALPNNFALTSLQLRHKDISRSPANHLLNSSAYVSLIRVCKSIATGGGQGRARESEQGWRIACGQVVGVCASMSCRLHGIIKNSPSSMPRYHARQELL